LEVLREGRLVWLRKKIYDQPPITKVTDKRIAGEARYE